MTDSQTSESLDENPTRMMPPAVLAVLARRPTLLVAVLGLILWLPGILSLPPLDRDESRFAQSSRQMIESGDLIDIRFGHVPRYKKPVGIYWLQAASTTLLGLGHDDRIWTYRVPSLVGAIVASRLTIWCAMAVMDAEAALLAGLMMLGSVLLTAEATIATTDAVLLACVVGVQGVLLRVWCAAQQPGAPSVSNSLILSGWAAVAAGVLIKFPILPGVALVTIAGLLLWDRRWRWLGRLRPLPGLLLALGLVAPWLVAIAVQSHGAFFQQSLGNDFAAKLAGGQESHGLPPGYYLLLSSVSFWPAIIFVLPAVVLGIARRSEPAVRFLLVWAGGWWLLIEAVPTKLPHYILPAYPALAILAAQLLRAAPPALKWLAVARWIGTVQFVVGAAILAAACVVPPLVWGSGLTWWLVALAGLGTVTAIAAAVLMLRRQPVWALLAALMAMLIFVPTLTMGEGPRLQQMWVSRRLHVLVAGAAMPGDPPPALAGYQEPSLVFALGKDVRLTSGIGAAEAGARSGGLALVDEAEHGRFLARLAELQADAVPVGSVSGFNYSRGRGVRVTVYRVAQLREIH